MCLLKQDHDDIIIIPTHVLHRIFSIKFYQIYKYFGRPGVAELAMITTDTDSNDQEVGYNKGLATELGIFFYKAATVYKDAGYNVSGAPFIAAASNRATR